MGLAFISGGGNRILQETVLEAFVLVEDEEGFVLTEQPTGIFIETAEAPTKGAPRGLAWDPPGGVEFKTEVVLFRERVGEALDFVPITLFMELAEEFLWSEFDLTTTGGGSITFTLDSWSAASFDIHGAGGGSAVLEQQDWNANMYDLVLMDDNNILAEDGGPIYLEGLNGNIDLEA